MIVCQAVVFLLSVLTLLSLNGCTQGISAPVDSTKTSSTLASLSIKTIGSSSTIGLLSLLEKSYSTSHENIKTIQMKPGQSESIIEGIKLKVMDVGTISKTAEKVNASHNTLNAREIVQDLLLVATHPSVTGVKNLTTKNLQDIYSGTISNWQQLGGPKANIALLDRPDDESAKQLLRKYYLGTNLKNSPKAIVFKKEGELIESIQNTPYSIGAFSLAYAISHQLPVNHLSLNGIAPTRENFMAKKYSMARPISVVWHKKSSAATQDFIKYVLSPAATGLMEKSGFIVSTGEVRHQP